MCVNFNSCMFVVPAGPLQSQGIIPATNGDQLPADQSDSNDSAPVSDFRDYGYEDSFDGTSMDTSVIDADMQQPCEVSWGGFGLAPRRCRGDFSIQEDSMYIVQHLLDLHMVGLNCSDSN